MFWRNRPISRDEFEACAALPRRMAETPLQGAAGKQERQGLWGRTVIPLTVSLQRSAVGDPAYSRGRWKDGWFCLWERSVLPNRPQMRNRESSEDRKRHLLTSHHLFVPGIQHSDRCSLPKASPSCPWGSKPSQSPYTSVLAAKVHSFSIFCAIS